jgi:hypothetical protein
MAACSMPKFWLKTPLKIEVEELDVGVFVLAGHATCQRTAIHIDGQITLILIFILEAAAHPLLYFPFKASSEAALTPNGALTVSLELI